MLKTGQLSNCPFGWGLDLFKQLSIFKQPSCGTFDRLRTLYMLKLDTVKDILVLFAAFQLRSF